MNWIHPEYLWTAFLVIPLVAVVLAASWWHRKRVREAFGESLWQRVLPRSVRVRRTLRDLGALMALLCGAFALAEPAFDKSITQQKVKGVDLVIALDLSRSMDARDVDPSRLERARREIIDLLELVSGDRVAVVFFAGDAIARLPLTEDYRAVRWLLDEADTSMFGAQGSNLARAIAVSRDLLARDEGKAGKALVVFSDGETQDPEAAIAEAAAGRDEGLVIYTVGIGEQKSTIPDESGALRHKGAVVYTEPDFTTLNEVASRTGGAYVKSVASASDMRVLYAEIRKGVASVERETVAHESWNSAYQVPLGAGLLLWLGGAWIGDGRRRFGTAGALLLAVSIASHSASAMTPEEADALYRQERYPAAETAFEELTLSEPTNPDWYRRLGATRYRIGDYVGAARAFERADQLVGGDSDALFNAGNARYRAGQLETALERYDRAIQVSGHQGAQANRQVVASELQARRAEQPPPPPPPEPQGGGEDEDQDAQGDQGDDQQEGGGGQQDEQNPSDGDPPGDEQSTGDQGQQEGQQDQEQDGSADAEGQEKGEQQSEGQGQQGENSDQESGDPQDSEGITPDQLDEEGQQGDDGGNADQGDQGDPSEQMSGNITPAQAARMIDGVEEGRMRVRYTGASADQPW